MGGKRTSWHGAGVPSSAQHLRALTDGARAWLEGRNSDGPTEVLRFLTTAVPTINAVSVANAMGVTKGTLSRWLSRREPIPAERRRQALELLRHTVLAWSIGHIYSSQSEEVILRGSPSAAARSLLAGGIVNAGNLLIEVEEERLAHLDSSHNVSETRT